MTSTTMQFARIRTAAVNIIRNGALNTKAQRDKFAELILRIERAANPALTTEAERVLLAERIIERERLQRALPTIGESTLQSAYRLFYTQAAAILTLSADL